MTSLFYKQNNVRSQQIKLAAERIQDPVRKQQLIAMSSRVRKVNVITGKYSNVINMVATPLLTLLFWLMYRRYYNYIECLVANMYFVGFTMLLYALLIVPLQHLFPQSGTYIIASFFVFEIIYRGFAYYQLINKKGTRHLLKSFGLSLFITFIWVSGTYTLIANYIRTGF